MWVSCSFVSDSAPGMGHFSSETWIRAPGVFCFLRPWRWAPWNFFTPRSPPDTQRLGRVTEKLKQLQREHSQLRARPPGVYNSFQSWVPWHPRRSRNRSPTFCRRSLEGDRKFIHRAPPPPHSHYTAGE